MEEVVKRLKNFFLSTNLKAFVCFFSISAFLHFIALDGEYGALINGGDIDYPINSALEIKRTFQLWSDDALGVPVYFAISKLFLVLPQYFIEKITGSIWLSNFLYFSLLRATSGYFMYILLKYLKTNRLGIWVGSMFFMLNTFIYLRFQFPQPHLYYAYNSIPILLFVFLKTFKKEYSLYSGIGLFSLIMISISRAGNIYLFNWLFIPLIAYILHISGYIKLYLSKKSISLFFINSFLLNTVVLFTFFSAWINYSSYPEESLLDVYRADAIKFAKDYVLHESMAGFGSYAWSNNLNEVKPGDHNFPILGVLSKNTLFTLSIFPIIYIFLSSLNRIRKRGFLLALMLFFGVLINGYGVPFGGLYESTLGQISVYVDLFRDSWTYWSMPYFFLASLIIGLSFDKGLKLNYIMNSSDFLYAFLRYQLIIVLFILFGLLYLHPGKMINPAWINKIPESYEEVSTFLNENAKNERVLALPLTRHIYGYTYTDAGYAGPDIMQRMANVGFTDKHFNQISTNRTIRVLDGLIEFDKEHMQEYLYQTQTSWVLVRKDFIDLPGEGGTVRVEKVADYFSESDCWRLEKNSEDLAVYHDICNSYNDTYIELTNQYIYGDAECMEGVSVDRYYQNSGICGLNPKNQNFYIEDEKLFINNEDQTVTLDLESRDSDLLVNYNFLNGVWNEGDLHNCDSKSDNVENIDIDLLNGSSLEIESYGEKVCIFEPVINDNIGSGGILKIRYKTESQQNISYCLFDREADRCHYLGDLDPNLEREATITSRRYDDNYIGDYIYLKDLGSYRDHDQLYLYVFFNDNKSLDYEIEIDDLRLITTPNEFGEYYKPPSSIDEVNIDIQPNSFLFGTIMYWNNNYSGDLLLSYNQNFNSQWKVLVWEDSFMPKLLDSEQVLTYDYANGWFIEDIEQYSSIGLVYVPQILYIFGVMMTTWVYVLYALIALVSKE